MKLILLLYQILMFKYEAKELDITLVPYENERGMEATRALIGAVQLSFKL